MVKDGVFLPISRYVSSLDGHLFITEHVALRKVLLSAERIFSLMLVKMSFRIAKKILSIPEDGLEDCFQMCLDSQFQMGNCFNARKGIEICVGGKPNCEDVTRPPWVPCADPLNYVWKPKRLVQFTIVLVHDR
uniref:Uncharacterized protein n=1 Tax=Megaselia scalaris TaxID=36166 RepID=T1GRI6_MEGSC